MLPNSWPYYYTKKIRKPHQPRLVACEQAIMEINVGYDDKFNISPTTPPESDIPKPGKQWPPQDLPELYRELLAEFSDIFVDNLP